MNEARWSLYYFRDSRGREPVRDFINSLDPAMRARVAESLVSLREAGIRLGMPHARPVSGYRFWELRVQATGNITRVFYFADTGRRLVLLHGFIKKDRQTPRAELGIAHSRYQEFLDRRPR